MEHLHSISEQLYTRTDKFKHNLHKFIAQHPLANKHLGDVATMFGLSRAAFICYVVVVILAIILGITSVSFLSALITISFPLYKTKEVVDKRDKKLKKAILCYWLIYFVIYQFERTVLAILPYISFYVFIKTGFLISCYSREFKQSEEICNHIIALSQPHLAELKTFFGDGIISSLDSTTYSSDDFDKEVLYGIEVYINSAELDVDKDTSVICQVTAIPASKREAFGIENTKFKSQILMGKKNFSFQKSIYLYPISSLDGIVKIELKEKDTFTDESESTTYLTGEMKVSELKVGSGQTKEKIIAANATRKIFNGSSVCQASIDCSLCVIKKGE